METQMIKLEEIDEGIISTIRDVNPESDEYAILKKAILTDGQRYPITVRELTDEEIQSAIGKTKYGIIDGHHRFHIAKNSGQTEILASIDNAEGSKIGDITLAFKLNNANIRMKPAEKGKVICELKELYEQKGENKNAETIGKELFGLKKAMTYRCLQAYNKISNEKESSGKTEKKEFDYSTLSQAVCKLPKDIPEDPAQGVEQLNVIREIEKQLRLYKAFLLNRKDIQEMYKQQKKKSDVNNSDQ